MTAAVRALGPIVLLAALPAPARAADTKELCARNAELAQTLQDEGKLLEARARLVSCADAACPSAVRNDCVVWLARIDTEVPSVVVRARDPNGRDIVLVRVRVDGQERMARLDGKPIPLDPGEHRFRYEAEGFAPVEEHVLVAAGERTRPLLVTLSPVGPQPMERAPRVAAPEARAEAPARAQEPAHAPTGRVLGFGALGVGALALGAFAIFEALGQSEYHDLSNGCAPTRTCPPSEVDAARTKFLVAGTSLAVAGVALATGAWLVWSSRDAAKRASVAIQAESVWARIQF